MRRVNNITGALARHEVKRPWAVPRVINPVIKANLSPRGLTQTSLNLASDLQEDSTAFLPSTDLAGMTRLCGRTHDASALPLQEQLELT